MHRMTTTARVVVFATTFLLTIGGTALLDQPVSAAGYTASVTPAQLVDPGTRLKDKPSQAPTTAAGYAAMFARVPVSQWGGGDVSISTKLRDGRRVWLYGDTLSTNNGSVHSSAIVQKGGTLRVSRGGKQVLPDGAKKGGYQKIYWIETVRTTGPNKIRVTVAPMAVGTRSVWDFHRTSTRSVLADLKVGRTGDVTFIGWRGATPAPNIGMDGDDLSVVGPHHFNYAHYVHDIRLSDGHWLETVNQNWDDSWDGHRNRDASLRVTDWRPVYRESATRTSPYWGR